MQELLFEIGTEEIPSAYQIPAVESLKGLLVKKMEERALPHGKPKVYSTPRRLAVSIPDIPEASQKELHKVFGPPKKVAVASDGSYTEVAVGFAKSKGMDISDLNIGQTDKGEYIYVELEKGGMRTKDILKSILPQAALSLSFPKSMRWGNCEFRFTRPIRWIVAIFGGEVIPFDLNDIQSGDETRGHRFLGSQSIKVTSSSDYLAALEKNFVIAELDKRIKKVLEDAHKQANQNKAKLEIDEELPTTVACLTEWPIALWGSFDKKFLDLPEELLITSMKTHQKMFAARGSDGKLTNGFVGVSNMKVKDNDVVIAGYHRVLSARLYDAKFFFDEDTKHSLESYTEKLSKVVYQKKIGTVGEKINRFTNLAENLADNIKPELKELTIRAAKLCKADLETLMVYEFPELQGIMGREYAKIAKEPDDVCVAIFEHYLPRWAGDNTASTDIGAFVGLADKIDTLVGCFGIGLIPTGTADPFALRRTSLGIIQTITKKRYRISLSALLDIAIIQLKDKLESSVDEVKEKLLNFFEWRLKNLWVGQGIPHDVADSIIAVGFDDLALADLRVKAMNELKERDFFEALVTTFKRVSNITKNHKNGNLLKVDESLFESNAERELYSALVSTTDEVKKSINDLKHIEALEEIAKIRPVVDRLFDDVMVMAQDKSVRENRLNLLKCLALLFEEIADFAKLVAKAPG